jgi:hypothetical protein
MAVFDVLDTLLANEDYDNLVELIVCLNLDYVDLVEYCKKLDLSIMDRIASKLMNTQEDQICLLLLSHADDEEWFLKTMCEIYGSYEYAGDSPMEAILYFRAYDMHNYEEYRSAAIMSMCSWYRKLNFYYFAKNVINLECLIEIFDDPEVRETIQLMRLLDSIMYLECDDNVYIDETGRKNIQYFSKMNIVSK